MDWEKPDMNARVVVRSAKSHASGKYGRIETCDGKIIAEVRNAPTFTHLKRALYATKCVPTSVAINKRGCTYFNMHS